jgi:hypothetical protein
VLRLSLILFFGVIALLTALAFLPETRRELPDSAVILRDTSVTLHPQADSEAVWYFASPEVAYAPEQGVSTLYNLTDGRRTVNGTTDFTLQSDELVIDRDDNLRGDLIHALLQRTGECLTMAGSTSQPVVINQRQGRFEVPVMQIDGPSWGSENRWERVSASFDLESFTAGGPGTNTVNEFMVNSGENSGIRRTLCDI